MRHSRMVLLLLMVLAALGAPQALAGPRPPSVPPSCQQINNLLHIDNVKNCDPQG